MTDIHSEILSAEEQDVLQEIMNIGFGSAAADLAEVIEIYVILSVPMVKIVETAGLLDYIKAEVREYQDVSIIEQNFWSKFKGVALLVFSGGAGKALLSIISHNDTSLLFESDPIRVMEKETLMEVGNILVGACVGKVAELLGDVVSYSPPRVLIGDLANNAISGNMFDPKNIVIIMQAVFHFEDQDVNGYLFLIASHESIGWLKEALRAFMKQYE